MITERMLLRATLGAIQALAERLTGDALVVTVDRGDGAVCRYENLPDGCAHTFLPIPKDLSIAGRVICECVKASALQSHQEGLSPLVVENPNSPSSDGKPHCNLSTDPQI